MPPVIKKGKWIPALLSALIVLAMWSNALAGVFCRHMSGGRDCCLLDQRHAHSKSVKRGVPAAVEHMHMDHSQMSDMDMEDGSMDMSATQPVVTRSQENSEARLTNSEVSHPSSDEQAITQPNEPCSHCLMHSRTGERFPISVVQNNSSDRIVPADTSAPSLIPVPSPFTIVELHDHSPPGSSAPLYVLVSAFRI